MHSWSQHSPLHLPQACETGCTEDHGGHSTQAASSLESKTGCCHGGWVFYQTSWMGSVHEICNSRGQNVRVFSTPLCRPLRSVLFHAPAACCTHTSILALVSASVWWLGTSCLPYLGPHGSLIPKRWVSISVGRGGILSPRPEIWVPQRRWGEGNEWFKDLEGRHTNKVGL